MNGLLRQAQLFSKRHGATILTIVGGIGVIVTSVMAVKATPKATELIEKAKKEKGEDLTTLETVKAAWKPYSPAVMVGIGTVSCIIGANVTNKRHQAALVSAYALVDSSFKQYKQKLIELYGKDAHDNVIDAIAAEKAKDVGIYAESMCTNSCLTDNESCGEPVLFYDEFSNRYFESTIEQVITAEYHFNRNFVLRGYCELNELYEFLGLATTDYGSKVGWSVEDELYWVDFNHRKTVLNDGLEVYIIETPWGPSAEALSYYYW